MQSKSQRLTTWVILVVALLLPKGTSLALSAQKQDSNPRIVSVAGGGPGHGTAGPPAKKNLP
jgi:hypothetical protein